MFRYDRRLKDNEDVTTLIAKTWTGKKQLGVKQKIDQCRYAIITWNKAKQRNSQARIEELKQELEGEVIDDNTTEESI